MDIWTAYNETLSRRSKPVTYVIKGECWICTSHSTTRYGYATAWYDGRLTGLHRAGFELANGVSLSNADVVRHTCDTPACINPAHLLVGSHTDNVMDRVARQRSARGTKNGRAKLTVENVAAIRASNLSATDLAANHGVDTSTIYHIRRGTLWRQLI